jgi:hypothetical protein
MNQIASRFNCPIKRLLASFRGAQSSSARACVALLLLACALPAHGGALRVEAMFASALETPTGFVAFNVPAQPLVDEPSVGNDGDLLVLFDDGVYLEIGASWVISSDLGGAMQFDQNITNLMVNEDYLPTDAHGLPVGGAGPYNNGMVGPTSALFINALGIGTAPQPGGVVGGVLLRNVFEGATPLPNQVLAPTARFTISTPGAQAVIARQIPEPGTWIVATLAAAAIGSAQSRRRFVRPPPRST